MIDNDENFRQWMRRVNRYLEQLCGMCADDLPDCCYRDWFEEGMKPERAARKALKNAKD